MKLPVKSIQTKHEFQLKPCSVEACAFWQEPILIAPKKISYIAPDGEKKEDFLEPGLFLEGTEYEALIANFYHAEGLWEKFAHLNTEREEDILDFYNSYSYLGNLSDLLKYKPCGEKTAGECLGWFKWEQRRFSYVVALYDAIQKGKGLKRIFDKLAKEREEERLSGRNGLAVHLLPPHPTLPSIPSSFEERLEVAKGIVVRELNAMTKDVPCRLEFEGRRANLSFKAESVLECIYLQFRDQVIIPGIRRLDCQECGNPLPEGRTRFCSDRCGDNFKRKELYAKRRIYAFLTQQGYTSKTIEVWVSEQKEKGKPLRIVWRELRNNPTLLKTRGGER